MPPTIRASDNSTFITGKARHSAHTSWIFTGGVRFNCVRADIGDDPENPDTHIAWKVLYTAKDTWLGPQQNLGAIGSYYNMTFNGAMSTRLPTTSPGRYAGYDSGWAICCSRR